MNDITRLVTQLFNLDDQIDRLIAGDWIEQQDLDETIASITAAAIRTNLFAQGKVEVGRMWFGHNNLAIGYGTAYGTGHGNGIGTGLGTIYNDIDTYSGGTGSGDNNIGYGYGTLFGAGFGDGIGLGNEAGIVYGITYEDGIGSGSLFGAGFGDGTGLGNEAGCGSGCGREFDEDEDEEDSYDEDEDA